MNWKNIKSFLIILFLCIDIFLVYITNVSHKSAVLSDENINDTVSLLRENDIYIDSNIIPKTVESYESIELSSLVFSDESPVDKSLIDNFQDGTIKITLPADTSKINEQNAKSEILKILKNNGFDTRKILLEKAETDAGTSYIMTSEYKKIKLFNNSMKITVDNDFITLSGTWFKSESANPYNPNGKRGVYATSALIAYISYKEQNIGNEKITITDICFGYHAKFDKNNMSLKYISASPCYRLTDESGNVCYYNIINGEFEN